MGPQTAAEQRRIFRVKAAGAVISLEVNGVECALLDVHSEGFAIASKATFHVGEAVHVIGRYEANIFAGSATVRNARPLGPHKHRYGLQTHLEEFQLRRGLRALAIGVQRRRLRRMAERRADSPV